MHWKILERLAFYLIAFCYRSIEQHFITSLSISYTQDGGILCTTYDAVRIHVKKISDGLGSVDYMFADEGHMLQNESKSYKSTGCYQM
jgi:hypothetical protein